MTLESLDQAVENCLDRGEGIRMGISKHYFYRSLYAVQLYHCFKVRLYLLEFQLPHNVLA
jgi:hypothetical protein